MQNINDQFCARLFDLIEIGDLDSLKNSLKFVDDVNSIYFEQKTLLFFAIVANQFEIVKYLVSIGSNVNSLNGDSLFTPFEMACYIGNMDVIQFLLSHGALVSQNELNYDGMSGAIEGGHLNVVKFLINNLNYNVNEKLSIYERSPIFFAIEHKQYDIFNYLILLGADLNFRDKDEVTPLIYCAIISCFDYAKYLITYGADINLALSGNQTALYFAVKNNDLEMVKLLLNSGALFSKNYQEITLAIRNHFNDLAIYLINFTSIVCIPGQFSALEDSLYSNNLEFLKYLFKIGVIFNQMKTANNCFIYACIYSSEEIIKYLINQGCDINQTEKFSNLPPMNEWGYKADYSYQWINNESQSDWNDDDDENVFTKYEKNSNEIFYPPLYFVSAANRVSIAKLLIDNGANPNSVTIFESPLFPAIFFKHFEMVKFLISRGAEINMKLGMSPLFYAMGTSSFEMVDYLIKYGADVNHIYPTLYYHRLYSNSFTILVPVVNNGFIQIMKSLIQHNIRFDSFPTPNALINYVIAPPDSEINSDEAFKLMKHMFKILCDAGVGLYDSPDNPLLFSYVEYPDFFKYLIQEGVNIGPLYKGKNIIHHIAAYGDIEQLKDVLKYKIPLYKIDNKGRTPYDLAIQKEKYEMASFLDSLISEN